MAQQAMDNNLNISDSLVMLQGRIIDSETGQPVQATVYYEKLPYGNDIGIINTEDSTGLYQLLLFNRNSYKLYVRAPHYLAYAEKIEFENNQRGEFRKDIPLVKIREGQLMKLENLNFEQGDFTILEESYEELELLVNLLRQNETMVIQLEGHTDYRGNRKLNFTLSENRVNAVRDFLVARGISKKRIKTKAFGGSHPLSYEDNEEARKVNRRVEVRILNLQTL